MKPLGEILKGISVERVYDSVRFCGGKDLWEVKVSSICFDSRKIKKNSLFVAIKGNTADGHNFIDTAITNGAKVIVCKNLPEKMQKGIIYIKVKNTAETLGFLASNFYDRPSTKLKLIGVTGTNGKTTTVTLLYHLFKKLGYKVGLLSTIRNVIHNKEMSASLTTPDAVQLNYLMSEMVKKGCKYCFMEVSSHAIAQNRIAGLTFAGGIFTNITHDHLDYHKTFNEYLKAKKRFFDNLSPTAFALTNQDDKNGLLMLQNTKAKKYTYSLDSIADFKARIIECNFFGMHLIIDGKGIWSKLTGRFNAYNLLATYSTGVLLKHDKQKVLTIISNLEPVEGRLEIICPFSKEKGNKIPLPLGGDRGAPIGIVDYAHTPDALKNVLKTINNIRTGKEKLITVIGCGGDRDAKKRPLMGKIASSMSDKVIFTSDNPRSENPLSIVREMKKGVAEEHLKKVLTIVGRKEAIKVAVSLANKNDIILIAGKGHENYQEIKGKRYPFDDMEVLREMM